MNRKLVVFAALVATAIVSTSAWAHGDHEEDTRAVPKTCAQLADTKNFTNDTSYPEVKALKAKCEAEKKAAEVKPAAKPS